MKQDGIPWKILMISQDFNIQKNKWTSQFTAKDYVGGMVKLEVTCGAPLRDSNTQGRRSFLFLSNIFLHHSTYITTQSSSLYIGK